MKNLFVLLVAFTALTIVGCSSPQQKAEKAIEDLSGGTIEVDASGESVVIKDKDGNITASVGKASKVPSNFPSDVYVYKNASIESIANVPGGMSVVLKSNDSPSKIMKKYGKEMPAKGWNQNNSMNMGGHHMIMFSKSNRIATIAIEKDGKSSVIALTLVDQ